MDECSSEPLTRAGGAWESRDHPFAHQDTEGVTVWDLIVDEALQVNCLQLEVDGDVDQPIGGGLGEGQGPDVSGSYPVLTLQLAEQTAYSAARSGHCVVASPPHPPTTPANSVKVASDPDVRTLVTFTHPSSAGPLSPSRNRPQEERAILVEFQGEVLVTGAAIQEIQVLNGDVGGSVRRIHLDTV